MRASLPELHVPASSKHALGCLDVLLNGCSVLQLGPPAWLLVPPLSPSSVQRVTHSYMPWRQNSVEMQVLQAALQDMPTGNVKPVHQFFKTKPEANIHPSRCLHKVVFCASTTFRDLVSGNVNKNFKNKIKWNLFFQWKSLSLRCRGKMLPFTFWCNQSLYVIWALVGNSLPESCLPVGVSELMRRWELTIIPHTSLLLCMDGARLVPRLVISVSLTNFDLHRGH